MKEKAIILAAGEGTRMKSKIQKVLHKVAGKPMIEHIIDTVNSININEVYVVVGHQADEVKANIKRNVTFGEQKERLGTGHAIMQVQNYINDEDTIVILCGDTPIMRPETLKSLINRHIDEKNSVTVLTTYVDTPTGYGRIIRDKDGNFSRIVEEKDASDEQRKVKEINGGVYCFHGKELKNALSLLNNNNAQNQYYLTDTLEIIKADNKNVGTFVISDFTEVIGINNKVQLAEAEAILKKRINEKHMLNGVIIMDPNNTYIQDDVKIGMDTVIYPGVMIEGSTIIGENCVLGANSHIINCTIGNNLIIDKNTILNNTKFGASNFMPEELKVKYYFESLDNFIIKELFDNIEYPWEVLKKSKEYLKENIVELDIKENHGELGKFCSLEGNYQIGEGTVINSNVTIQGPVIIGKNCTIMSGVLIRPGSIISDNCVLGQGCQIKNALLFKGAKVQNMTFAGDTIVGKSARVGSGTILANRRFDQKEIGIKHNGKYYNFNTDFFGCVIGDNSRLGANCTTTPGTMIGPYTWITPMTQVQGFIPSDSRVMHKQVLEIRSNIRMELK